ncbi:hypothetical protein BX616_006345 [Lobosporangium transversale]|nr:hypothetical protein BX616_006345 [Lobosporangium transversale]
MTDIFQMDTHTTLPTFGAKPKLPVIPESIWLDIFTHLPLEEKFRASRIYIELTYPHFPVIPESWMFT